MKTAISLPDPLFKAAEKLAARLGLSRSELYQRALQLLLEKHQAGDVTAALDAVHGQAGTAGSLDPVLARMQFASLPQEDW